MEESLGIVKAKLKAMSLSVGRPVVNQKHRSLEAMHDTPEKCWL